MNWRNPLSEDANRRRFEAIDSNRKRLDACRMHAFPSAPACIDPGEKLLCTNCGGELNTILIAQYVRGFIAAGGDPVAVAPWWNEPLEG